MQVDRTFARLILAEAPMALLLGSTPALAQDAGTVVSEPLPLFQAICQGGGARLNRNVAGASSFSAFPDPARMVLGKVLAETPAAAIDAPAASAAAVPNTVYQVNGLPFFLIVPSKTAPAAPTTTPSLGDSCMVMWHSSSEDDYLAARKLVLPDEERVPLYDRPKSKADGFTFVRGKAGDGQLTLATYGGWIVLRSLATDTPADPQ